MVETNKTSAQNTSEATESAPKRLRVYRKDSNFKGAVKGQDFWYSATRSDGAGVICKFKCPIKTESVAFEIDNIVGNSKHQQVTDDDGNVLYNNYTYYITSCDFHEIEGEALDI